MRTRRITILKTDWIMLKWFAQWVQSTGIGVSTGKARDVLYTPSNNSHEADIKGNSQYCGDKATTITEFLVKQHTRSRRGQHCTSGEANRPAVVEFETTQISKRSNLITFTNGHDEQACALIWARLVCWNVYVPEIKCNKSIYCLIRVDLLDLLSISSAKSSPWPL